MLWLPVTYDTVPTITLRVASVRALLLFEIQVVQPKVYAQSLLMLSAVSVFWAFASQTGL